MPPKNRTSVMRNVHMPSVDASVCCAELAKWWRRCVSSGEGSWSTGAIASANDFLLRAVVIGLFGHDRGLIEIESRGWGLDLPFQARCSPRIVAGLRSVL